MAANVLDPGVRRWSKGADENAPGPEPSHGTPHAGAYNDFPDGPSAYRDHADEALEKLFRAAILHAQDRIDWYDKKASQRSRMAKRIRSFSLVLFAAGTLAPIVVTLLLKFADLLGFGQGPRTNWTWLDYIFRVPLAEIGYVLLALAGALIVFDQFFDASGSWIRFRQAQARLEVLLAELRFAWAELLVGCSGNLDPKATTELVRLLRAFVTQIELLAEAETKEWAQRFSQRINAYDRNPNLRVALERDDFAPALRRDQTNRAEMGRTPKPEQADANKS
jgi:hypothetical protein